MILKFLRKRKNMKRIMWALAILIIPAFVIWGAGSSTKDKTKGVDHAGKIFNKKISFEQYVAMWHTIREYASRTFKTDISDELIDQLVWNRILLLEAADRENIVVKDSDVVNAIISMPMFQRDGVFDKKIYKTALGDTAKAFEEQVRDDLRIQKLQDKITLNVSVSDEEVKDAYKKKLKKIVGHGKEKSKEERETFKKYLIVSKQNETFNTWFDNFKKDANFISYTSQ